MRVKNALDHVKCTHGERLRIRWQKAVPDRQVKYIIQCIIITREYFYLNNNALYLYNMWIHITNIL